MDFLTIFFLVLMGFIVILFFYIQNIYDTEKEYNNFHDSIYKMQSLDKSFDSFLLIQRRFINLDKITKNTKQFREIISKLINSSMCEDFDKSMQINLMQIKKLFLKKQTLIEKFKSYNATSIYSIAYLIDLSKTIQKDKTSKPSDTDNLDLKLDNSLYNLFKLYLNLQVDDTVFIQNITKLNKEKYKTKELNSFIINAKSAQDKLRQIVTLRQSALKIPLYTAISELHKKLDTSYSRLKIRQDMVSTYMFLFAFLLLGILIYIYKKSLRQRKELISFRYAVQNSDDTIVITDVDRNITYVNEAFTKSSGYSAEEAIGQNPRILKSGKMPQEFYDDMNALLDKGKKWTGEFINKDKHDRFFYEKASITPMFVNNKLRGYLGIKLNITDYVKEQEKVRFLAYHDSLTTLPNRREMKKSLKIYFDNLKKDGGSLYLLFLDLDGFKNINDTLGHDAGDMLLRKISHRLKTYATKQSYIFRTGGDEFAIILKDLDVNQVIDIAENIVKIINKPIDLENQIIKVGVSIGIAKYNKKDSVITILKNADIAMYEAKNRGKNHYRFFNDKLAEIVQRNMNIQRELSNAFENHEFYAVYQPKYKLLTKKVISLETLIRWKNKELGLISPEIFIPIAENTKVIHEIGLFVFEQTCKDFKEIQNHCPNIRNISVNVSISQLLDDKLPEIFLSLIQKYDLAPHNIGLELTETHIMNNVEENINTISNLRNFGFKIIIDDFGTGHSSMSYLKKLPITNLKIDKSFVDDICSDKNDLVITKSILDISKNFGYITTAEGIETQEQEDLLLELGVDMGQGYLFSEPKKKEDLLKFLDSTCKL